MLFNAGSRHFVIYIDNRGLGALQVSLILKTLCESLKIRHITQYFDVLKHCHKPHASAVQSFVAVNQLFCPCSSIQDSKQQLSLADPPLTDVREEQPCTVLKASLGSQMRQSFGEECLLITKAAQTELDSDSTEPDNGQASLEWIRLRNGGSIQDFHEVSHYQENEHWQ